MQGEILTLKEEKASTFNSSLLWEAYLVSSWLP